MLLVPLRVFLVRAFRPGLEHAGRRHSRSLVLSERASVPPRMGAGARHLRDPCFGTQLSRRTEGMTALRQITVETKDGRKAWTEDQVLKVRLLVLSTTHALSEHASGGPIPRHGRSTAGGESDVTVPREKGERGGWDEVFASGLNRLRDSLPA